MAWFWINHSQTLQPNWLQMKDNVWKSCKYLHWLDKLRLSIQRFFEQFATENSHALCYWPSIHHPILPGRSVQNFKLSISTFLMSRAYSISIASWEKLVPRENISTLIYVECGHMYQKKCLLSRNLVYFAWPQSSIAHPKRKSCLQNRQRLFKVARYEVSYTVFSGWSIQTYGLMVKVKHNE